MPMSVTCAKISVDASGRVSVHFSDQNVLEFTNKAAALLWAGSLESLAGDAPELLKRLLAAWWLKQDPAGNTPSLVVGKTITVNLSLSNILTVS